MLDHVSLGVSDLQRSRRFYDAVLLPRLRHEISGLTRREPAST